MFRLDDFFRVCDDNVELPSGEKVSVRVLSDVEVQGRSEYSISEQLKIAEALRSPESEIYRLKIAPLIDATDEGLIETLAEVRRIDLAQESVEVITLDFFPYPDGATEQEKIDTLARQRDHESNVYASRAKYITEGEIAYRKRLAELPRESIVANAKAAATRLYILQEQISAELYYTVSHSVYSLDGKQKWSLEQVKNLPGYILDFLMIKYRAVDKVDPWELTKSLATGGAVGVESSH